MRAPCLDKNGLKKGAWSEEEDDKLRAYILRYGHWNWRLLPKFAGLARCGKSCRLRWVNYLKPGIRRGNYSKEEEDLIEKLQDELGNKWSAMAAKLPGRTDNEIKNYWHTHLKKRSKSIPGEASSTCVDDAYNSQALKIPGEGENDLQGRSDSWIPFRVNQDPKDSASSVQEVQSSSSSDQSPAVLAEICNFEFLQEESFGSFWTEPSVVDTSYTQTHEGFSPLEEGEAFFYGCLFT